MEVPPTIIGDRLKIIDAGTRDERFTGRISVDDATDFLRNSDELEQGQIQLSHDYRLLRDFDKTLTDTVEFLNNSDYPLDVSGRDIENLYLNGHLEDLLAYFKDTPYIPTGMDKLHSDFVLISRTGNMISNILSSGEIINDNEDISDHKLALLKIVNEYITLNPESTITMQQKASIKDVADFIEFYQENVHQNLDSLNIVNKLADLKESLIASLSTRKMKQLFGKENAERMAKVFTNQTLIISDPLTTLLEIGDSHETLGWFHQDKRLCYIDPIVIDNISNNEESFEARLLTVMAHEFIHASTDTTYQLRGNSLNELKVNSRNLWPQFFYEAMTEKAAFLIAFNARPELFESETELEPFSESLSRQIYSDNPKEILAPDYIKNPREIRRSTYYLYRLLLDTIMNKADWESAGITRQQADRLAINAFFNRSDDTSSQDTIYRKKFMQSLHTATHPGFLNKLGQLIDIYGPKVMIDVIESPKFDFKNPDALPLLANHHIRQMLQSRAESLEPSQDRLERLEAMGASEVILEHQKLMILRAETAKVEYEKLNLATQSLLRVFYSRYGSKRRMMGRKEHLLNMIFQDSTGGSDYTETVVNDLDSHLKTVVEWQEHSKQKIGKWYA